MRFPSVGTFAVAVVLCVAPLSLRSPQNGNVSLSIAFDSARAAELNVPVRNRNAVRYSHRIARYSRLYDPYCGGPYVGGGFNGGTYYGGPWIDLRCYGSVY